MRELYGNVRKMKEWKKVPDCRRGHGMDERRSAIEGKRKYIKKKLGESGENCSRELEIVKRWTCRKVGEKPGIGRYKGKGEETRRMGVHEMK